MLGILPEYVARDKTDLIPSYWNRVTLKRCTNAQLVCEIHTRENKECNEGKIKNVMKCYKLIHMGRRREVTSYSDVPCSQAEGTAFVEVLNGEGVWQGQQIKTMLLG